MRFNISKITRKIIAMTFICSLFVCNVGSVDASSISTEGELKNYKGHVSAAFTDNDSYGCFHGKINLTGGARENLKVKIEAYYFTNSSDRKFRRNVHNYVTSYSATSYSVVAGGKNVTYPLCTTGYPCTAIATINGSYQGKAQLYSYR